MNNSNETPGLCPKIMILTDEVIAEYSKNNVLTDYRDVDLKIKTRIAPYQNGIYDQDIFGSMFSDRCNCGNIRTVGVKCPRCGSTILDEVQSFQRFARIESPVYFSSKFKVDKLIRVIKDNFNVELDFNTELFKGMRWNDAKVMDICQWNWDAENEVLTVTDNITDFTKCSYEGLLNILSTYHPELLTEFRAYINRYILVTPMILRAPGIKMDGNGNRMLENNYTSTVYKNIIYCINEYYKDTFPTMKSELDKAIFRGALRRLISSSLEQLTMLFRSSKQNLARMMQSNRMPNSGRCTIVPDTTLKADEVKIPVHLMYEACRSEFIEYIAEKKHVTPKEAEYIYKTQAELDEIQQMFQDYINGEPGKPETAKRVIINRAPTLYDLGMFSCKVILTRDYVMRIPQVLCKPLGGDFDGDTMSYYSIPKKMNNFIDNALSARNRFVFKKNKKPLFTPTQEVMRGLTQATKVSTPKELEVFDSIEDAKEFRKNNRDFKYQTLCQIKGVKTTLGRAILTEFFDKDINAYLGGFDKTLTGGNVTLLYEQLRDKEDRVDRIQAIQEFATLVTTLSGATSIKLSDLYVGIDESYMKRIKAIENNQELDDKVKELKIREIFGEYQDEMLKKIPDDVRMAIEESQHMKTAELRDLAVQQLNVGPHHDYSITETTLTQGMTPLDYMKHAIENRSLQDIKQSGVPLSGYVTRQFTYLASEYYLVEGLDEKNEGIYIPLKDARGRTSIDGKIIEDSSSKELVKVRSIITSTLPRGMVTSDMLSNLYSFKVGSKVGMNLISSLTEPLTQLGLSLKHGGHLFNLDLEDAIIAPEDGELVIGTDKVILKSKNKEFIWPKSENFVMNYMNDQNQYKKGEVLGRNYHPVTATYAVDRVIKLCGAKATTSRKKYQNNVKLISDCYAIEDGIINYKFNDDGVQVFINGKEYNYSPDCLYYYPNGTEVKKLQRICSGTLDVGSMIQLQPDYVEFYYLYRKQFKELLDTSDELIEFLYVLIIHKMEGGGIEVQSVAKNIYGSESFFKSLAFADARKSFQKVDYRGLDWVADPITDVILSLIMQDNIQ